MSVLCETLLMAPLPVSVCYLANLKPKHLLEVCRLADEEQVESPAPAEVRHNDGVHGHGGKEGPPGCVEFL